MVLLLRKYRDKLKSKPDYFTLCDMYLLVTFVSNSTKLIIKLIRLFCTLLILVYCIFRQAVSKFRKDQKVCSQGLNLLMQLIRHLDDQANPGPNLQTSRDYATHILNAFW